MEFAGRVAAVTGGAAGIGRAAALAFAREGAAVVLGDLDQAAGEALARDITAAGGQAVFVRQDVADAAQASLLLDAALSRFGRLDHAFNNAGITSYLDSWDPAAMQRVLAVNLNGVMFAMGVQIAHMAAQGGGTIVNTASVAGLSASGTAEYVASKHGVVGLTRAAGVRYAAAGVRINCVCPGVIETAMIQPILESDALRPRVEAMVPIGRFGRPEEVADAVLFLSSPRASFVVAHALTVDGGFLAR